ncbi:hypothetical protein KKC87_04550 [Patescibacteria group bacterium]|nr:hypothetical protein [Patescibacteria group bacterium]
MINTHAKGLRVMRKAREYWQEKGGEVFQVTHGWSHKDMFGMFDQMVLLNGRLIFVQIKANSMPSVQMFELWKRKHNFPAEIFLMCWVDRKGWWIKEV